MDAMILKMVACVNAVMEVIKSSIPSLSKIGKIVASFLAGIIVGIFFYVQGNILNIYSAIFLGLWSGALASGVYDIIHNILKASIKK